MGSGRARQGPRTPRGDPCSGVCPGMTPLSPAREDLRGAPQLAAPSLGVTHTLSHQPPGCYQGKNRYTPLSVSFDEL